MISNTPLRSFKMEDEEFESPEKSIIQSVEASLSPERVTLESPERATSGSPMKRDDIRMVISPNYLDTPKIKEQIKIMEERLKRTLPEYDI